MKDNFSTHSDLYATFRPTYPSALFAFLDTCVTHRECAWDCGTGNGQVASVLAATFRDVQATDISASQLRHAFLAENIHYSVQPAEQTNFPNAQFDLITVAQAIHWFDFEAFYNEVRRTLKPNGILAVMGYGLLETFPEADRIIADFYKQVIGKFWDAERKYVDAHYRTIPFPFDEIEAPSFVHIENWTFAKLMGYLGTWSAVKHYQKATGQNPLDLIRDALQEHWGEATTHEVKFPILLRIGKCAT